MKNIWKNHKLKIILTAYALVAAALVYFLVIPLVAGIRSKSDDIQEKMIDSQINQSRLSNIPQMEKDYAAFQDKKDLFNVVLNANDEVSFIKKLESLAQETGNAITLQVDNTNQKPAVATNVKKKDLGIKDSLSYSNYVSMQINLTGNYAGLVNFMHKLENDDHYVNIISMDLSKTTQTEEGNAPAQTQSSGFGVFAPSDGNGNPSPAPKAVETDKDILKSVLNVVVYIKK